MAMHVIAAALPRLCAAMTQVRHNISLVYLSAAPRLQSPHNMFPNSPQDIELDTFAYESSPNWRWYREVAATADVGSMLFAWASRDCHWGALTAAQRALDDANCARMSRGDEQSLLEKKGKLQAAYDDCLDTWCLLEWRRAQQVTFFRRCHSRAPHPTHQASGRERRAVWPDNQAVGEVCLIHRRCFGWLLTLAQVARLCIGAKIRLRAELTTSARNAYSYV